MGSLGGVRAFVVKDLTSQVIRPHLLAVAGGSGSGKTTLVSRLRDAVGPGAVLVFGVDHYYRDLSQLTMAERDTRNFDHPDAIDAELMTRHLAALARGETIERPTYDFATHTRAAATVTYGPRPLIVVDGILALHWPEVRDLFQLRVYVDVDDDVRFIRRLKRDVSERGRTVESVTQQYLASVKAMHDQFVAPQKHVADIIVSWMDYNDRAVGMLAGMAKSWIGG